MSTKAPTGLRAPGRNLWNAVAGAYVLTPAESAMLEQACRTADELDRIEKAVRQLDSLITTGSTGQLKSHPLLEEVRRHRVLLERLTSALCLPNEDEEVGLTPGQKHGRKAINARWHGPVPGKLAELHAADWSQRGPAS
jgi:Phage terminase, small subunit